MICPRCKTELAGDGVEEQQKYLDGKLNVHTPDRCTDVLKKKLDAALNAMAAIGEVHNADARRVAELEAVLKDCGRHAVNADTCGVCKKHFKECEEDRIADEDRNGVLIDVGFACPGARARELLAASQAPRKETP
jgi:hypothetical protein